MADNMDPRAHYCRVLLLAVSLLCGQADADGYQTVIIVEAIRRASIQAVDQSGVDEQAPIPQPGPSAPPAGTQPGSTGVYPSPQLNVNAFNAVLAPGRCRLYESHIKSCAAASGHRQSAIATFINDRQNNRAIGCCQAIDEARQKLGGALCGVVQSTIQQQLGCAQ